MEGVRQNEVGAGDDYEGHRRSDHPPARDDNFVLLQGGEHVAPTGSRFAEAEAEERKTRFGEGVLRYENGGLSEQDAGGLGENVAAQEIPVGSAETPTRDNVAALFRA